MKITEAAEVLKSSVLAPLFVDLDKGKVETSDDCTTCTLRIKNPVDDSSPFILELSEDDTTQTLRVLGIAKTKDLSRVARVGHFNHVSTIEKLCWNPEDGEIYVEIAALKQNESGISPAILEKMAAHALFVFFNERHWFLKAEINDLVEKKLVTRDQAQALLTSTLERHDKEIKPLIQQAL